MPISDAWVMASCDGERCRFAEDFPISPLGGGAYDQRSLPAAMDRHGWVVVEGKCYCEACATKMGLAKGEEASNG